MAFSVDDIVRLSVRYTFLGQLCMNVYDFKLQGDFPIDLSAPAVGADFWDKRKTTLRALAPTPIAFRFLDIQVKNLTDPLGDFGTFPIPVGEVAGTRSVSTDALPPYTAVGMRLTVGTRATRPGQKRFAGLYEADQAEGVLVGGVIAAAQAVGATMNDDLASRDVVPIPYGTPVIVHLDPSTGLPETSQPILDYILNPNVDTQVSRKFGRGV